MLPLRIELLGNVRITYGPNPVTSVNTNRLQSLLALLALNGDVQQSREHLAFLLWPESGESQARTNLRQLLHHLRRALPEECRLLSADNQTVQWRRDPACTIDVVEFEAAVSNAEDARKRGDAVRERRELEEAARLYQDDLLRGLYDEWVQPKREQLRQQIGSVLSRLASLLEELGDYPAAIRHAEHLIAHDPLSETHFQMLIRLHARNHDRASALRAYHQCMRVLRRELGVDPGPATRSLFDQVLKAEPLADPRVSLPPPAAASPWPMVGRKEESDRLVDCWRLAASGRLQLALIEGEPGIGKTRLADELFQWCSTHQASSARALCYAAQGQLAYAPIAEWLRAEPLRAVRSQLPAAQLTELARVLPEILVENAKIPAPQPLTESWQRRHFYEALLAVFAKARTPLLLLIDDLQWCDQDSFEWLHSFFRSQAEGRILVLGTVRTEETGRRHPLAGLLRELRQTGQVLEIPITALSGEETAALASQVANRQLDAGDWADLYGATQGNPLFVVETVRARLEESGATIPHSPPRIHAVITARLAQLTPPAYELAGLAGAIGTSFSHDLLAKATDWDEDSLLRALEELWERRIVEGKGAGEYDFTHDRLREVAYAELSPVRRRFLHRRVARALEEVHAENLESVAGQLAVHYEHAGMVAEAIRQYLDAAKVAGRRYADAEAAGLIRRALALCRDLPEGSRRDEQELLLLVTLGPPLIITQGYSMPEVGETYGRALALSRTLGEKTHLSSVLAGSGIYFMVRGDVEKARALGEELLEFARGQGVPVLTMAGHFLLGSSLFHSGEFQSSLEHMGQALDAYGGGSHPAFVIFAGPDIGVLCQCYQSHVLWLSGFADQASGKIGEAIGLARASSHPFSMAIALDYWAMLLVFRRESREALARAQEAVVHCRRYGFVYYLAMAEILSGWAAAMEGDVPAGLAQLKQGLDGLKATGAELRLPFYHGLLAEVYGLAVQTGEALANVATAFAFQNKNGELWAAAGLHRIQGDLLRLRSAGA